MNLIDAVIFDLDGTLFQADKVALDAFRSTFQRLKRMGLYDQALPTRKQMIGMLGKTLHEIWEELLPDKNESVKKEADNRMLQEELRLIKEGKGALYPHVFETLKLLHLRYPLFIASNGRQVYVETACRQLGILPFFEDIYTAGKYQINKVALVHKIITDHEIKRGVMVGDRQSDVEAGLKNNLYVVGCLYGFGTPEEFRGADACIDSFELIASLIPKLEAGLRPVGLYSDGYAFRLSTKIFGQNNDKDFQKKQK